MKKLEDERDQLKECMDTSKSLDHPLQLYALGLRGKEVGDYLEAKGHYNMSSAIRKKLGLGEHNTNLFNYVRDLLTKG